MGFTVVNALCHGSPVPRKFTTKQLSLVGEVTKISTVHRFTGIIVKHEFPLQHKTQYLAER